MACTTCNKNPFQQAKAIVSGTLNYIFDSPEIEAIALPRLTICKECPFARELIKVKSKSIMQCTQCKCLIELKTRYADEVCPKNKW